jgi:probable HAF family extracellular repeat protein
MAVPNPLYPHRRLKSQFVAKLSLARQPVVHRALFTLLGVLFLGSFHLTADALYSLTLLANWDVGSGRPINDVGQVVGNSITSRQAVLYDNGNTIGLGVFSAIAINNAGEVAGSNNGHAVLYSNGQLTDLGTLGGRSSSASGINDAGQVTGVADTADGVQHAFLYATGQMIDIGSALGGTIATRATAINNAGQIVGTLGATSGFLYSNGQITPLGFSPTAINNAGQVVGSNQRAVLYSNGQLTDLGTLGDPFSRALGINDRGQVVGSGSGSSSPLGRPFLYSDGQMRDLNSLIAPGQSLHPILNQAVGINNNGQIVATARFEQSSYLLTPVASTIPEPSTLGLVGVAFAACFLWSRNRRSRQPGSGAKQMGDAI